MRFHSKTIRRGIEKIKARIGVDGLFREFGDDLPLRSELFNLAQLENHAEALADWHQVDPRPGADRLLTRLAENERILLEAHKLVTDALARKRKISPAGEWLLDNFYLIQEQIRTARRHLPKQYSRWLPRLVNGPSAGYPRVYDIALELISHVDGRVDRECLRSFVAAYQKGRNLQIGELWAFPIMMRQALIENLRRVAGRIATAMLDRKEANEWADRFIDCAEKSPRDLVLVVADMARPNPALSTTFVAELARRLQGQNPCFAVPLTWIEQRLAEQGQTTEQMVQADGQQQAVNQVSIGNSINSLRELDAVDWRELVESLSVVEQTLRGDPAGVYGAMDFGTRDQYRHVVEDIARRSPLTEHEIATRVVALAREAQATPNSDPRRSHVGYFLIDQGLPELEHAARMRLSIWLRTRRLARKVALPLYLGSISLVAAVVAVCGVLAAGGHGVLGWIEGLLVFVGANHLGMGLVNWVTTMLLTPHRLPRLDFSVGIPEEFRTLVAVPTMLVSPRNVAHLLEGLEVRYLASRDPNLRFCLLTDFCDAAEATLPADESLLRLAQVGIEALNDKYRGDDDEDLFFLFHRPRRWNPSQKTWMGYERKRGKLGDLNSLLRGGAGEAFSLTVGETGSLKTIRFVITLDTDTFLAREAAPELVGTMAHILNRPRIDAGRNIVTQGYGILQPGVAISFEKEGASRFSELCSGDPGIDPYTRTTSDVYQDLFHEGSFIGKGIYDVDAFIATMEGRFPDNQILSHDLLEGCYARSGLVSDIHVYESYPSRYSTDVSRRHRWIRGDWQIAGWLLPFVRNATGERVANPLSALSRWKILDNLRRSVVPSALRLLLLIGWLALPPAWMWTALVLGIVTVPAIGAGLVALFRKADDVPLVSHPGRVLGSICFSLAQALLAVVFLPYEAYYSVDAIVRTVGRMLFTRTQMLEWKTASDAERDGDASLAAFVRTMAISPALTVLIAAALAVVQPTALWAASPLLLAWLLSPLVAWWISLPPSARDERLSQEQSLFLHRLSRQTWRFFETFVTAEDHWLPPDNFQEYPVPTVAHRTSPTNIGVALLSNLAAFDFGYISIGGLIGRTEQTLRTMGQLERFHGHFLNWYDTRTLQPLFPKYVSTVDSGNLAGHLLTLRRGLLELPTQPIVADRFWNSLRVTLEILDELSRRSVGASTDGKRAVRPAMGTNRADRVRDLLRRECEIGASPRRLTHIYDVIHRLISVTAEALHGDPERDSAELAGVLRDLERQCRDHHADLVSIAPWLECSATPAEFLGHMPPESAADVTRIRELLHTIDEIPRLETVALFEIRLLPVLDSLLSRRTGSLGELNPADAAWLANFRALLLLGSRAAAERIFTVAQQATRCGELADLEFDFLYDKSRRLLAIGYNVSERRRDASYYDLLASEARLASFVAIAQGKLPQEHWFALGRLLTTTGSQSALLSWSGSMFEYLMPTLVMPSYANTLLDQTCRAVISRQIEYGKQRGVPWGVSESGYNATDAQLNYQYRAFGVPGLGFKRGLADDLVIAPYATAMGLMVAPEQACANLEQLVALGFSGQYGLYEAIDYTTSRLAPGQLSATIRSHMSHHQGMAFLSLAYRLLDRPMQRRFAADPQFQAAELLLQERIPRVMPFYPHAAEVSGMQPTTGDQESLMRLFTTPHTPVPEVNLLSNGRYHVMVTNAGGGYSHWKGIAVTRWREDATLDQTGMFCYLRDVHSGEVWSTAYQPTLKPARRYEAIFSQSRAEFRRRDGDIRLHTEIVVSPEDDVEIRRSTITNRSRVVRTIDLTSYAEVVLAPAIADAAHPAFSNLFVQTEIVDSRQAILCTRRPRSHQEQPPFMLHLMAVRGGLAGEASYETDRLQFIGRGQNTASPAALASGAALSNSAGSVLDPIVAIRRRLTLAPEESVVVDIVTGMAESRVEAVVLIDKYHDRHLADRAFEMSWTHGQVLLSQLNATEANAQLFGRLASAIVYANPARRAAPSILLRNLRGQYGLWGHGISGDLPIVLLRIGDAEKIDLVRQMVQAHAYWRLKGLAVDLVIWNESPAGYRQVLQDLILGLISAGTEAQKLDHPGGIFVRRAEQLSDEDRILMQTVARAILVDTDGTLAEQMERRPRPEVKMPELVPSRVRRPAFPQPGATPRPESVFFNGLGGFTADGREYVIRLNPGQTTPAPWVNVLANAQFGTIVSESGGAYTWSENAHEFRLTPWRNDPVTDASGEAYYLRDEETGHGWSPTPRPAPGGQPYVCRHGFGYTVFEHSESGLSSELWIYVAQDEPIKFAVLKVRNTSGRLRRLSATAYTEWVLGEMRSRSHMNVVTEIDPATGAMLARNPYSMEFSDRIAFCDVSDPTRSVTGDRTEFLGRNGTLAQPAALTRTRLSGRVGAGLDPCGAMQVAFELADGCEREVVFTLGAARSVDEVRQIVQRFRAPGAPRQALEAVWSFWNRTLGAVHVETPDAAVNLLANGWLLYQTLACRFWARSGFYQSGGAIGFRDQLQDSAALLYATPNLIREHLLLCAAHQFEQGDVQHWWHPPFGRGVRTHFSDDFLWLPLVACRYISGTGDTGVLDENVSFLDGRPVSFEEDAYYDLPTRTEHVSTLYEHCVRAITRSLGAFGEHGLPLIGCGDWNDGMNLVGEQGRGESVWLAFFLYEVLERFAVVAENHGDATFAQRCRSEAGSLRDNIERNAWDGGWYRRAYFDNGEPLGSAGNLECQIDSIPQSWAVLSGAGDPERSRVAMEAVNERLVRRGESLIQLFDPPFDKSSADPGYIKGYVPGVRENGGQYTHAAIWTVMAFAKLGDASRAWELFSMIHPIHHGSTPQQIAKYKVEPYVVAADVYAVPPHTGRGGWTWYTGSSGWMYRLIVESLLGLRLERDRLRFTPCLPADWKSFKLHYRHRETFFHITVKQLAPGGEVRRITVDGNEQPDLSIPLWDDRQEHHVDVELGSL